jgi:hypothetical protein
MNDNNIHETNRNPKTARATSQASLGATERWPRNPRSCSNRRGIAQFCRTLERCLQKRWPKGTGQQAAAITPLQTFQKAVPKASETSFKGPKSQRLQNRLMDAKEDRCGNPKTLWCGLSALRCLVCAESTGLELPKARTQGQRTQRTSHRSMAKATLAAYKKKPEEKVEPSYWLMRAVLCFSQPFAVPGHRRAKHLFNTAGTVGTDTRPYPRSVFLQSAIDWGFILPYNIVTSAWTILRRLYRSFWNTFPKALSWFLIAGWCIAGQKEDFVRDFPDALMLNGSRPMLLNLIQSNRYGTTPSTATLPTTFPRMYLFLRELCVSLSIIRVHKNPCYAHFSKNLDLKYDSFL